MYIRVVCEGMCTCHTFTGTILVRSNTCTPAHLHIRIHVVSVRVVSLLFLERGESIRGVGGGGGGGGGKVAQEVTQMGFLKYQLQHLLPSYLPPVPPLVSPFISSMQPSWKWW